mgnify:CR=1 FL=1
MKKTILIYESDKENKIGTLKAEGNLLDLIAGAGEILKEVSKVAAKALDEEPADIAIRIAGATIDMLTDEKKGEANE